MAMLQLRRRKRRRLPQEMQTSGSRCQEDTATKYAFPLQTYHKLSEISTAVLRFWAGLMAFMTSRLYSTYNFIRRVDVDTQVNPSAGRVQDLRPRVFAIRCKSPYIYSPLR